MGLLETGPSPDDRTQDYQGKTAGSPTLAASGASVACGVPGFTLAQRLQAALGPQYRVGAALGQGGMGAVFRTFDTRLNRDVAVKVLFPELGVSRELRARLLREAQTAARLFHPHIVPVHAVGETEDLAWFVMAFIDGTNLRELVQQEGPLSAQRVLAVLQGAAQALAYGHAHGVIHRDVKPDNIMIERWTGRPLLTDFGIAHVEDDVGLTSLGQVLGTARYMAPEQALGQPITDSADIYSLGLVGCFMFTGEDPIPVKSFPELVARHVRQEKVDLSPVREKASPTLVAALERCLEPSPSRRFARMEEFLEILRDSGELRPETPPPVRQLIRETERLAALVGMVAFATGMIGVGKVQPEFPILLLFMAMTYWCASLEWTDKSGISWTQVRQAVRSETQTGAEAVKPGRRRWRSPSTWIQVGIYVGAFASFALVADRIIVASSTGWDYLLWAFGTSLLASVVRIPGGPYRTVRAKVRLIAIVLCVAGVMGIQQASSGPVLLAALHGESPARPELLRALGDPVNVVVGLLVVLMTFFRRGARGESGWSRMLDRLGTFILPGRGS
jgi:serine/threonine protein kinase